MVAVSFPTKESPRACSLVEIFYQAGNKDEGLMFLLTDSQITNERFLIYINDLLASGNIPDLFAVDEVDTIVSKPCRGTCGCLGWIRLFGALWRTRYSLFSRVSPISP